MTATDGIISSFALFMLMIILLLGGLAVDYSNGVEGRAHLKAVVDSAALSAALDLPDEDNARTTALNVAALNAPSGVFGSVVASTDVSFGRWEAGDRTYTDGDTPVNAVRVRGYRNTSNDNALRNYFLWLVGEDTWDISAEAIAIGIDNSCKGGGFFTNDMIDSGSNNSYDSFCLYGGLGVKISSDNSFDGDSSIMMPSLNNFTQGGNNTGVDDALQETSRTLPLLSQVSPVVASMQSGSFDMLPSNIYNGPVYLDEITDTTTLIPHTLYIVANVADFGSNRTLQDIAVVANLEVKTGSNVTMRDVFFASNKAILFGSTNDFGTTSYCSSGTYSIHLFSEGNIEFGSYSRLRSIVMAAKGELKLGSELYGIQAVYGEAELKITYGSADEYGSCENPLASAFVSNQGTNYSIWGLVQ